MDFVIVISLRFFLDCVSNFSLGIDDVCVFVHMSVHLCVCQHFNIYLTFKKTISLIYQL